MGQGVLKLDIHFDFVNSTIAANSKLANSDINNIVININIIINTNNTVTELIRKPKNGNLYKYNIGWRPPICGCKS